MIDRTQFIGGTDASRLMRGDWLSLYEEKVGLRQPDDLSDVFRVQLGIHTEPFHLQWIRDKQGVNLVTDVDPRTAPDADWMRADVDALVIEGDKLLPLDAKHSNGMANKQDMVAYYQAQVAHYAMVYNVDAGYISYIAGNSDPVVFRLDFPPEYMEQLLDIEQTFWQCVQDREPPVSFDEQIDDAKAAAKDIKLDRMRAVDMSTSNEFVNLAGIYLETKDARDRHEYVKKELKSLVESDVYEATGGGVVLRRDKRGSLRISEEKE